MYVSLNGLSKEQNEGHTGQHFDYESECLDFVALKVNGSCKYMSVPRESACVSVPVWIAEKHKPVVLDLDPMTELTPGNIGRAFAV